MIRITVNVAVVDSSAAEYAADMVASQLIALVKHAARRALFMATG